MILNHYSEKEKVSSLSSKKEGFREGLQNKYNPLIKQSLLDKIPIPIIILEDNQETFVIKQFNNAIYELNQLYILLRNNSSIKVNDVIDPEDIGDYERHGGYEALKKALDMGYERVIEEVSRSGLRGRGGGGNG